MKKVLAFLILVAALPGCKKEESGTMLFKNHYTTSPDVFKANTTTDTLYTGYGDYIASLTPYHFSGKFRMLGFQDDYNLQVNTIHMLLYVEGNMGPNDPLRTADFSNNALVSFSPDLRGIQNSHGLFVGEQIDFIYFQFSLEYFYQEVALPPQYDSVNIDMFNINYCNEQLWSDSVKVDNVLKVKHHAFISRIFNTTNGWPEAYVFGNCDSTFVFNTAGNTVENSENWPYGGSTMLQIIRSNQYSMVSVNTPSAGLTVSMVSTVGFDTKNLIQIYAGADNIPFTGDDIFIYAPKYWERIRVKLEIQ